MKNNEIASPAVGGLAMTEIWRHCEEQSDEAISRCQKIQPHQGFFRNIRSQQAGLGR